MDAMDHKTALMAERCRDDKDNVDADKATGRGRGGNRRPGRARRRVRVAWRGLKKLQMRIVSAPYVKVASEAQIQLKQANNSLKPMMNVDNQWFLNENLQEISPIQYERRENDLAVKRAWCSNSSLSCGYLELLRVFLPYSRESRSQLIFSIRLYRRDLGKLLQSPSARVISLLSIPIIPLKFIWSDSICLKV
jgi:hypothetical protein